MMERDFTAVDIESFRTSNEETSSDPISCSSVDGSVKGGKGENLGGNAENGNKGSSENLQVLIELDKTVVHTDPLEKKSKKDKRKTMSAKKHPKPPRPPRGLSLDAADQKLIKELAELAMIKRARIERMKALKKMKAGKGSSSPSSSGGSFFAMLLTVLFCVVIVCQGSPYLIYFGELNHFILSCLDACSIYIFKWLRSMGIVDHPCILYYVIDFVFNDLIMPTRKSPFRKSQV